MGLANAQRTLNYIRIFAEFISQPEYANVVPMFGIMNEPLVGIIGQETLTSLCVAFFFIFVSDSVNARLPATWKPTGLFVVSQALAKAKVHTSRSAMVLAASQLGPVCCPMPIGSLSIRTPISHLAVLPTLTPSTSQHRMVRWGVSGQGRLAQPGRA